MGKAAGPRIRIYLTTAELTDKPGQDKYSDLGQFATQWANINSLNGQNTLHTTLLCILIKII